MSQPQHNALETPAPAARPHGDMPNTPLASATVAFLLGATFNFGLACIVFDMSSRLSILTWQLGFFVSAWSFFHWAEFAVTAGWNLEKCSIDSYLLNNGRMYHVAHSFALSEYLITSWFAPQWKSRYPSICLVGVVVVLVGQILRSGAMITAATNFSHAVAHQKRSTHQLVTSGIYSWLRHPSYTGFFYWALGTQLVLRNPVSFFLYFVMLYRFFSSRIVDEERFLLRFFGNDYIEYRQRVGTLIPFIP